MFVKPGPHPEEDGKPIQVRFPVTGVVLPEGGGDVPETQYWYRRLLFGDVVAADKPAEKTAPPPEKVA